MIRTPPRDPARHRAAGAALGRSGLRDAAAAASYLLVTAVMALPLLRDVSGLLPGDRADPVLNAWLLWWNTQSTPFTGSWWNAPAFHPYPGALAYSEHLLGLLPLSGPLQWLTGSPVVTYNLVFLLTFPLCGAAGYVLGRELTGRRDAAWIAGLVFAFAPYRMSQLSHLQVLAAFWMPLALAALHRYLRDPRPRWLAAFAGATTLQGLTNGYYLAYFPVLVGLWAVWFSRGSGGWRGIARIGGAGAAAMLPLVPLLATYRLLHAEQGLGRAPSEIAAYSADLTSLAGIAPHLAFWGRLAWSPGPEQELFPGVAIVLLIGTALWRARGWRPAAPEPRYLRAARAAATALACLGGALLVMRLAAGPWAVDVAGFRVSVTSIDKIGAHFALAAAAALLLGRTCTAAWRRRSPFAFYLLAAAVLGLCAMGPRPEVAGTPVMAYSPYLGLLEVPGFEALRAPARFWMLVLVCLSALAALSCARLAPSGGRRRRVFFAVIAAGVLVDGWGRLPAVPSPSPSPLLEARAAGPVAGSAPRLAGRRCRGDAPRLPPTAVRS